MRTVANIMETAVGSLTPDMRLTRAVALLDGDPTGGAPVCDDDGRVVGVLRQGDLTDVLVTDGDLTVTAVMAPAVLSVREDAPIGEAIRRMASEGVHRLIVLDQNGRLRGTVSSMDILRELTGFERNGTAAPPSEEPSPAQPLRPCAVRAPLS